MSNISDVVKASVLKVVDKVEEPFSDVTPLSKFASRFSIKPGYIIIAFFALSIMLLAAKIFSNIFVSVFGMIYPAYMSYKAIEYKRDEQKKQWLTYWIVFGFFTAFTSMTRYFFFFLSIPAYNIFRILFYVYLFHPSTKGAAAIYNNHLKQKLANLQKYINTHHQ